jgi:hypothetical protein
MFLHPMRWLLVTADTWVKLQFRINYSLLGVCYQEYLIKFKPASLLNVYTWRGFRTKSRAPSFNTRHICSPLQPANTSTTSRRLIHPLSMSVPTRQQAVEVAPGAGISAQLADAARDEILAVTIQQTGGKPATFVAHQAETRAASNEFLKVCIYIELRCYNNHDLIK